MQPRQGDAIKGRELLLASLAVLAAEAGVRRCAAETPAPSSQPAAATQPAAALPGPRYAPIRCDDDFSYLDGPEGSYRKDFFDPIKRIRLGDDLTLRLGGEIRGRVEAVTHKRYGAEDPAQDTFFLHRYYYHADLQYRGLARFFIEGVSAWVEDRDNTPIPQPEDRFDIHQMFMDLRVLGEQVPLSLRFGRQELLYGKQRLVSPLDWANVRRTWDGVKLFWRDEKWNVDGWYVRPVELRNRDVDEYDEKRHFFGLYSTYKGIKNHGMDAYVLGLVDEGDVASSNLRTDQDDPNVPYTGDLSVYTLGGRLWGKTPVGGHWWDYDTEFAGQWGRFASDVIQAWMWSAETGYAFSDAPWSPRIGVGIDYASGDEDPHDGVHQTFNQLFPLGHAFFGYLDQIGRQNLWAQNVNLSFQPHPSVTGVLAWHTFWTDKNRDALYDAGGARVRRSPSGGVGDEIGHELDLTLNWQIDPHASLLLGYSHLWTSDFISGTGSDEDPDLFYVQYGYKF